MTCSVCTKFYLFRVCPPEECDGRGKNEWRVNKRTIKSAWSKIVLVHNEEWQEWTHLNNDTSNCASINSIFQSQNRNLIESHNLFKRMKWGRMVGCCLYIYLVYQVNAINHWPGSILYYFGQKNAPTKRIRFIHSPLLTSFSISRNESSGLSTELTSKPNATVPTTSIAYLNTNIHKHTYSIH